MAVHQRSPQALLRFQTNRTSLEFTIISSVSSLAAYGRLLRYPKSTYTRAYQHFPDSSQRRTSQGDYETHTFLSASTAPFFHNQAKTGAREQLTKAEATSSSACRGTLEPEPSSPNQAIHPPSSLKVHPRSVLQPRMTRQRMILRRRRSGRLYPSLACPAGSAETRFVELLNGFSG